MTSKLLLLAICAGLTACSKPEQAPTAPRSEVANDDSCVEAGSGVDYRNCWWRKVEKSQARVATALDRNMREAEQEDAEIIELKASGISHLPDLPTHVAALRTSQEAWQRYADAQCELESYKAFGGTAMGEWKAKCHERLNLQRLAELRSPFIIEERREQPLPVE